MWSCQTGGGDARNLTGRELQALLALSQFALELIRVAGSAGSAQLLDAPFRLGESGSEILVSALELGALAMAAQAIGIGSIEQPESCVQGTGRQRAHAV